MTSETNSDSIGSGENAAIPADFPAYLDSFPFSNTTSNLGRGAIVNGTDGNDSIENHAGDVFIYGFDGDDYIYSDTWYDYRHRIPTRYVEYEYISGGYWEYSYIAGYVTINAGLGNDTIHNADDNEVYMQYVNGDGDDVLLYNYGTIQIADGSLYTKLIEGNDQIIRVGLGSIRVLDAANANVKISGGALQQLTTVSGSDGNDRLSNNRMYSIVDAGAGNDTISNFAYYASIGAGAGDDYIINDYSSSINAGRGNDTIELDNGYNVIEYRSGDGNDLVLDYDSTDTIRIADGSSYSTLRRGEDVIVSIGSGSITLEDADDERINIVSGTLVSTGGGDQNYIRNTTSNTLVSGTSDDDTIFNRGANSTIRSFDGDDSIKNDAAGTTIYAGAGDDFVETSGENLLIDAGAGNDTITISSGWNSSIDGGAGDDYFGGGTAKYSTLRGGSGNDTLNLSGTNHTFVYANGDGNDLIRGYEASSAIKITDGSNYSTLRSGSDLIVSIGSGSITIKDASSANIVGGTLVTTGGGSNSTLISTHASNTLISGTSGNDSIESEGSRNTINAGRGNDTIDLDGNSNVLLYASGDGNDLVRDYDSSDTINITDGASYRTLRSGENVIISIGSGSITLDDADDERINIVGGSLVGGSTGGGSNSTLISTHASNTLISGTSGNDSIESEGSRNTINAGRGNDTIELDGDSNVILYASGDGNDLVRDYDSSDTINITDGASYRTLRSGENVIISIGSGSITLDDADDERINIVGGSLVGGSTGGGNSNSTLISTHASNTLISGTSGNDSIESEGSRNTINAGRGNDTIDLDGNSNVILYASGDGNDLVRDYDSSDTINITDGASYRTLRSGSDVIVSIGSGSITLDDADDERINIVGGSLVGGSTGGGNQNYIRNTTSNTIVSGSDGDDTIENEALYVTINGGAGNDLIENDGRYVMISSGAGNDFIDNDAANATIYAGEGNDTLDLDGALSFVDAGAGADSIDASADSYTLNAGAGNDTILLGSAWYSSFNGGEGNDLFRSTRSSLSLGQSTLVGGAGDDTFDLSGVLKTIEYRNGDGNDLVRGFNSYDTLNIVDGSSYSTVASGSDVIVSIGSGSITLADALDQTLNIVGGNYVGTVESTLRSNDQANTLLGGTDGNDTIRNTANNVTVRAGGGNDVVSLSSSARNNVIQFGIGSGNDTVYGFDENDTIQSHDGLRYETLESGNDVIYKLYDGTLTLKDAAGNQKYIETGYNPEGIYNGWIGSVVSGSSRADFIDNYAWRVTVNAGAGDDTIASGWQASLSAINGGAGDDLIFVQSGYETVDGGSGDDTIYADLSSSKANRIYEFNASGGDDVIVGYNSSDTIKITDGAEYSTLRSGSDVLVNVGYGSITLKDASDQTLNIEVETIDYTGVKINKSGKTITIKKPFSGTVRAESFGDKVKTMNASSNPNSVELIGNDLNNLLKGSKGGSTLSGGAGNDKLYGGNGADTFIYDGGKDKVYKYAAGDRLVINREIETVKISGKTLKLGFGKDDSLTVQKGVGQELTIVDQNGDESTYLFSKQNNDLDSARIASNSQLPSYWFEEKVLNDPLDEILSIEKMSVGLEFDRIDQLKTLEIDRIVSTRSRREE